jgi:alkylation response protein AidB-like acyl-CoA dehydrogenase
MDVAARLKTPELLAFRAEVRDFLRANLPEDIRAQVTAERMEMSRDDQQRWQGILHAQGWGCPGWPVSDGGAGWSAEQHYLFERELALNDAPRGPGFGVNLLGPTVLAYGSEEQRRRFLPGIVSGRTLWCQGFSEPGAGSDLAALQCKAVRDGDHYVINGSKLWTTEAHIADWMFGLFRTDSSGKKQQGITFLLLDMRSPGITVHPVLTFEGGREVNQVFFDGVRVPVDQRLGEEHQGWGIAKYLLSLERFGIAEVSRSLAMLARLKRLAAEPGAEGSRPIDDPLLAAELARLEIELRAVELTELRFLFGGDEAQNAALASILKVRGTEVQQGILELTLQLRGRAAHVAPAGNAGPTPEVAAALAYYNYRKVSIYGGSTEVQKNIVAKAVLGL